MAEFTTSTERRSKLPEEFSDLSVRGRQKNWQDNSVKGIIKAVEWPPFKKAAKDAVCAMTASAFIGACLYLYGFGINQIIAFIR